MLRAAALTLAAVASGGVVTISGPSPFPACGDAGEGAIANAEVEPSLAVDPRDPDHVVVLYQQDRFKNGASRGIMASVTSDAGQTWRRNLLKVGVCATHREPPPYRATDPWASIGPDGRVYALASAYALASGDGGNSWSPAVELARSSSDFLPDKGSLTADPVHAGVAYTVWSRFYRIGARPPVEADTMFSKTTDGGRTWSRARAILEHEPSAGPIASVILVDRRTDRLFHLTFWSIGAVPTFAHPSRLVIQHSDDGGASWTAPVTISKVFTLGLRSKEPYSGKSIRSGFVVPSFAIDPRRGTLYAVWQDARFSARRRDQIAISRSADGGATWTKPALVSAKSQQAIVPTVAVAANGAVGVAYYETAAGRSKTRVETRYRFALSHDGGRTFATRTLARFDLSRAPLMREVDQLNVPGGLFLGDYMGLAATRDAFRIAFVTTNATRGNPTDVRYADMPAR